MARDKDEVYENEFDRWWYEHEVWKFACGFVAGMIFIESVLWILRRVLG